MCTARPNWLSLSTTFFNKEACHKVPVPLYDILGLNEEKMTVNVEPMVSVGDITRHSIYTWNSKLLEPFAFFADPVQTSSWAGLLGRATFTVHFISAPDQPERKRMYHNIREAKSLLY